MRIIFERSSREKIWRGESSDFEGFFGEIVVGDVVFCWCGCGVLRGGCGVLDGVFVVLKM
ncbi:hypothetical protein [Tunturibacter empetritectus]|uniref:Uncharacterized protein n=1 Tax=Tunturiibacter lichenicola TaxID=2051959 RepID=A0A7W8J4H5_9BACT|nr:hypothetical protein [Edaphobacter lichenicola]MBB5342340.1 hypothetical protein [Edaphobacter lichenicola]